jgi:hypothetical protein
MIRAKDNRTPLQRLHAHQKLAQAAIKSWQKAFAATFPVGKRISWTHGHWHSQTGVVESNETPFYGYDTDLMLVARNDNTGKVVRVRIHDIHGATPSSGGGCRES